MLVCHIEQRGAVQLRPSRMADKLLVSNTFYVISSSDKHTLLPFCHNNVAKSLISSPERQQSKNVNVTVQAS